MPRRYLYRVGDDPESLMQFSKDREAAYGADVVGYDWHYWDKDAMRHFEDKYKGHRTWRSYDPEFGSHYKPFRYHSGGRTRLGHVSEEYIRRHPHRYADKSRYSNRWYDDDDHYYSGRSSRRHYDDHSYYPGERSGHSSRRHHDDYYYYPEHLRRHRRHHRKYYYDDYDDYHY